MMGKFHENKYITTEEAEELARDLELTADQVKRFFFNRRQSEINAGEKGT